VHAPTEDKSDYMKDNFNDEQECVFTQFPKYHMKNFSGDFNAKVGGEGIFTQTVENEILHEINSKHCHIKTSVKSTYNVPTSQYS